MPRGGSQPGAGRPKGTTGIKHKETISKEAAREAVRAVIMQHHERMLRSQIAHSIGIGHLFTRDKAGKYTKIENQSVADKLLAEGEQDRDYYIFMKDPSVQAWTDLANRAFDKPKEQAQEISLTVELSAVSDRLLNARKRLALKAKNP